MTTEGKSGGVLNRVRNHVLPLCNPRYKLHVFARPTKLASASASNFDVRPKLLALAVMLAAWLVTGCGGASDFVVAPPVAKPVIPLEVFPAVFADPVRGAKLYATPPKNGLLICADCHSDIPSENNFGNIWSGRNAVSLIQRAVTVNTGGMGYFNSLLTADDFADIAAFLGNTPSELQFADTVKDASSATQAVKVSSSTKLGLDDFTARIQGDFIVSGTTCGTSIARFSDCTIEIAFKPGTTGLRTGALFLSHNATPVPIRIPLAGTGVAK